MKPSRRLEGMCPLWRCKSAPTLLTS